MRSTYDVEWWHLGGPLLFSCGMWPGSMCLVWPSSLFKGILPCWRTVLITYKGESPHVKNWSWSVACLCVFVDNYLHFSWDFLSHMSDFLLTLAMLLWRPMVEMCQQWYFDKMSSSAGGFCFGGSPLFFRLLNPFTVCHHLISSLLSMKSKIGVNISNDWRYKCIPLSK